jgi:hypothetical protein
MAIDNTANTAELRAAARLACFSMRERFTQVGFSPSQSAFYMYCISECAQEVCEELLDQYSIRGVLDDMINLPRPTSQRNENEEIL